MAMDSSALRELARDLGVGTDYWGWDGNRRDVDDDTLRAVLAGLGTPVSGDEDIAAVRARRERSRWEETLPPVTVLRQDRESSVPVHVDHGEAVTATLELEDGGGRELAQIEDFTPPFELDGRLRGRARFELPADLPLGWHRIVAETGGHRHEADVVVTTAHGTETGRAHVRAPSALPTRRPVPATKLNGLERTPES